MVWWWYSAGISGKSVPHTKPNHNTKVEAVGGSTHLQELPGECPHDDGRGDAVGEELVEHLSRAEELLRALLLANLLGELGRGWDKGAWVKVGKF